MRNGGMMVMTFMRHRYGFLITAVFLLVAATALRAQTPYTLQQRGSEAFKAHQFALAERLFTELVKQDPSGVAYSYLAAAEGAMGEYLQAIAHFQKAIQLGYDTPIVRYNLALAYLKNDQLEPGIQELRTAVAQSPQFMQARYALGVALLDARKPGEALTYLDQLQSLLKTRAGFWVNLVRAQFEAGSAKQALETIDRATEAIPGDTRLTVTLANLCVNHAQPQKARELLENATEAEPDNNDLKMLLAQSSLDAEEPLEAVAVLKNVPPQAGRPGQLSFLRGSAMMLGGKLKEAAPLLAAAVAADPHNVDYLSTYAELQAAQRNYEGALASLKNARQLRPKAPDFPYQIALIYVFMNRYADAISACQTATHLAPDFDQAYFVLGAIDLDRGNAQAAEEAFRRAESIKPRSALYHAALGAALFKNGSLAQGKDELDHALLLDPKTLLAYFWRAQVFAQQSETAKAIADLEIFVALDSHYAEAYKQLAQLYGAEGQQAKALAAQAKYKEAEQSSPTQSIPFFLSQLGATRFRQIRGLNQ